MSRNYTSSTPLTPLPRAFGGHRDPSEGRAGPSGPPGGRDYWDKLDRVQVLGSSSEGHNGCINALSWSEDGSILLSGSDDQRICIWGPDDAASSSSSSPHALKLRDTIFTGHRANIFNACFLPNASTPTIVSCAGDKDVRVFELERLSRAEFGTTRHAGDLWGLDGPGVRVLRCHTDRTKRIATESSPNLFLTVSEDGTVRQHDLRRPHRCREECPDPLFRAPDRVDLYSLSVSKATPHMFAVAGRTDCAYVCDRRMPERQTPSWGPHTRAVKQVHCVRRLGLPDEEWEGVSAGRSIYRGERHITCVKMSPHRADEVICAFAQHSTSLFSIYDSTASSSAKKQVSSSPVLSPNSSNRPKNDPSPQASHPATRDILSSLIKRRHSALSSPDANPAPISRARTDDDGGEEDAVSDSPLAASSPPPSGTHLIEESPNEIGHSDSRVPIGIHIDGPTELGETVPDLETMERNVNALENDPSGPALVRVVTSEEEASLAENGGEEDDDHRGFVFEDGDGSGEEIDLASFRALRDGEDDDDEDEDDDLDDDDFGDLLDESGYAGPLSVNGEYGGVDLVLPRRMYKGARNFETVKDCNFLGTSSEKVCSGSDDGNFFIWDKETGRLDGLLEGDDSVVNVVEQHPTLPLLAVSGIDHTVKMFAPLAIRPDSTFSRLHQAEAIIRTNMSPPRFHPSSAFGTVSILEFLASRGILIYRA